MAFVNRKNWYALVLVMLLLLSGCTGRQKDAQNETQVETQEVTQTTETTAKNVDDEVEDFTGPFVIKETEDIETEATEETKAAPAQGGSSNVPKETEEPTEEATKETEYVPSPGGNGPNSTSDIEM